MVDMTLHVSIHLQQANIRPGSANIDSKVTSAAMLQVDHAGGYLGKGIVFTSGQRKQVWPLYDAGEKKRTQAVCIITIHNQRPPPARLQPP